MAPEEAIAQHLRSNGRRCHLSEGCGHHLENKGADLSGYLLVNSSKDAQGTVDLYDCAVYLQDAQYIANLWIEAVREVGEENVIQFLSDSAANCKAAGQILQKE